MSKRYILPFFSFLRISSLPPSDGVEWSKSSHHITLDLRDFTDTYSYQLRGDRCLDYFLVLPRYVLSHQFWALPLFWALTLDFCDDIVAFVGIISNIYTVCKTAVFLGWICKLPQVVVGIISVCSFLNSNSQKCS